MKLFRCKIMGDVDNSKCYSCFTNALSSETHNTRVICKRQNVVEEISLDIKSEPVLALEEVAA